MGRVNAEIVKKSRKTGRDSEKKKKYMERSETETNLNRDTCRSDNNGKRKKDEVSAPLDKPAECAQKRRSRPQQLEQHDPGERSSREKIQQRKEGTTAGVNN